MFLIRLTLPPAKMYQREKGLRGYSVAYLFYCFVRFPSLPCFVTSVFSLSGAFEQGAVFGSRRTGARFTTGRAIFIMGNIANREKKTATVCKSPVEFFMTK